MRSIAPVEIFYVPGNHDEMLSYCATVTVGAYYTKVKGVTVDTSPAPRKYVRYGRCLIGYSHGKEENKRIFGLMQIEQPEAWGESKFREFHLGDLHMEDVSEASGVIVRRIPTITGTDSWHGKKGFIGAVRKAQAFIWDPTRGKILTIDSTVEDQADA